MNLVVPPTRPDCDAGLIIMEASDYPAMSGSNTICTATVLLETGMLPMREPVTVLTLDTPAGPVRVEAACRDGKVEQVRFANVPCFATHLDARLEVAGLGSIAVDVAYGGAFFAIVDAPSLGFAVERHEARDLVAVGNRIKAAAAEQVPVRHPENPGIHTVTFTEFAMPFAGPGTVSRNAVIVSPGRIDRSPCGTGTSARLAVLSARGLIRCGQGFVHESIIGSRFDAAIVARHRRGRYRGHRADHRRPGLDHRRVPARVRPLGPLPRGVHAPGHLVRLIRRRRLRSSDIRSGGERPRREALPAGRGRSPAPGAPDVSEGPKRFGMSAAPERSYHEVLTRPRPPAPAASGPVRTESRHDHPYNAALSCLRRH